MKKAVVFLVMILVMAVSASAQAVDVTFDIGDAVVEAGEVVYIEVIGNAVTPLTGAGMTFVYDSDYMIVTDIIPSEDLPTVLSRSVSPGRARLDAGIQLGNGPIVGDFTYCTLEVLATAPVTDTLILIINDAELSNPDHVEIVGEAGTLLSYVIDAGHVTISEDLPDTVTIALPFRLFLPGGESVSFSGSIAEVELPLTFTLMLPESGEVTVNITKTIVSVESGGVSVEYR